MNTATHPTDARLGRRRRTVRAASAIGCLALLMLLCAFAWRRWSRPPPLVMSAPPDWQKIDAGGRFTFLAPADLQSKPVQGIDSFVGEYRSHSLTLGFDFGWYSNSLDDEQKAGFRQRWVTVSGRDAKLVVYTNPASPRPYVAAIHFPDLGDGLTRLTVSAAGQTPADQQDAIRIFSSLQMTPLPPGRAPGRVRWWRRMGCINAVTVYCASSKSVPPVYFQAAAELGRAIAEQHWTLVYGGNAVGCMGALADAARAAGGKVVGITPQLLVDHGIADRLCDELIVTTGMRERKALLEQRGDAFIALPGGLGTFEEVFEILVGRTLGYHEKPIVLLNVAGYYDPLLAMIEHGIEHRFIRPVAREAYFVARSVDEAIRFLRSQDRETTLEPGSGLAEPSALE